MRQALHIFSKDVRHLWPEIAIALALAVGLIFSVASQAKTLNDYESNQGAAASLLTSLLPLAWAALIARAIYGEPLPGDRQFWVTRPYSRSSLLAAKALFVAAFVNLPKLLADIVILRAYGFRIWPELGGLLWTQVLLTAVFVLPVAALCAVTTGFVQLIIVIFVVSLTSIAWNFLIPALGGVPWLGLDWTIFYCAGLVVTLAALVIILRQYTRRETTRSRFVAGGALIAVLLVVLFFPWTTAFAIQSRFSRLSIPASQIHVGFDPTMKWIVRALVSRDHSVELQVPLRITKVPSPLELRTEAIVATIEGPAGEVWRADREPQRNVISEGNFTAFHTEIGPAFYDKVKNHPVCIRGTVYLTVYGNPRRTVLPIRDRIILHRTPGVGLCAAVRTPTAIVLNCRSAFRSRSDRVSCAFLGRPYAPGAPPLILYTLSAARQASYSPFPADANLIPVTQHMQTTAFAGQANAVSAVAIEPLAYIQRDFEITGLRLADFEVRR